MTAILSRLTPSRRWLQFGLRTMLLLTFAAGAWFGWFVDRAQRQKRAVKAIEAGRGFVVYRHELDAGLTTEVSDLDYATRRKRSGAPGPEWLCNLVGDEYLAQVVNVHAPFGKPSVVLKGLLQELPWLEHLTIRVQSRDDYACLQGLERLKHLHLMNRSPTVRLQWLRDSHGLEELSLRDDGVTENLEHLDEFVNLREMWISSESIADEAMQHIGALPRLKQLLISCECISADGMKALAGLKTLEYICLDCKGLGDVAAEPLKELTNLKALTIEDSQLTDAGLAHLENLPRLEILSINADRLTGVALARLNKNLRAVNLYWRHPITDADLTCFQRLPRLNDLTLFRRTTITDSGLAVLKTMPQLKEIHFQSPGVTKAGIDDLKRALPGCRVDIKIADR